MSQDEIIEMAVKCGIIPWIKHEYIGDQKYIWRADLKNDAIEDLRKARWYIDREIEKRMRLK